MSTPAKRMACFSLLSVCLSAGSFILIRILNNYILCLFLRTNKICHIPGLLTLEYCNGLETNWTEGNLLFIHTTPYLFFLFAGIFLPHFIKSGNWLIRLILSWISLHMVLIFSGGLVSGLFEYKGLGIPLTWFFINGSLRITGVIIMIILIASSARRFGWYFLKSVPDKLMLTDIGLMKKWLIVSLVMPLLLSGILVNIFTPLELLLNHSMSFVTGMLFMPVIIGTASKVYLSING